jgi:hypothetical protein
MCTPFFSTNKTYLHDNTEILLKVELNTITLTPTSQGDFQQIQIVSTIHVLLKFIFTHTLTSVEPWRSFEELLSVEVIVSLLSTNCTTFGTWCMSSYKAETSKKTKTVEWVSEWLLLNVNSAIFSYFLARTSYFSMRWWWGTLCTRPPRWVGFL